MDQGRWPWESSVPVPLPGEGTRGTFGAWVTNAIIRGMASASRDQTRPLLNGVVVWHDGVDLVVVATDTYRMFVERVAPGAHELAPAPGTYWRMPLPELQQVFGTAPLRQWGSECGLLWTPEGLKLVAEPPRHSRAATRDALLVAAGCTPAEPGQFPNFVRCLPDDDYPWAWGGCVAAVALREALLRLRPLGLPNPDKPKADHVPVKLVGHRGGLLLEAGRNGCRGSARLEAWDVATARNPRARTWVNADFLLDALSGEIAACGKPEIWLGIPAVAADGYPEPGHPLELTCNRARYVVMQMNAKMHEAYLAEGDRQIAAA